MRVLIVESHFELGCLWERALQRSGADVCFARSQSEAVKALMQDEFDIIVLDLVLKNGSAFAIFRFRQLSPTQGACGFCDQYKFLFGWLDFSALFERLRLFTKRNAPR